MMQHANDTVSKSTLITHHNEKSPLSHLRLSLLFRDMQNTFL